MRTLKRAWIAILLVLVGFCAGRTQGPRQKYVFRVVGEYPADKSVILLEPILPPQIGVSVMRGKGLEVHEVLHCKVGAIKHGENQFIEVLDCGDGRILQINGILFQ